MTPPVLSIAVDVSQVKKAISSSSFRSSQQIDDLIKRFNEIGVRIDRTSKSINDLATRMNNVARDDAFKKFAQDAKLSALEIARIRAGIGDLRGAFSTLWGAVKDSRLAIVAWGASLVVAGKAILDAQIAFQRLENSYKAVFGSGAASQLDMVYQQVDRVGLKFFDTANAAKSFFAAGQDTKLAPELENIFKALTDTGAALQLSTEEVNGAFIALGQMISKGKVQAEELRGQLGERLPGAFQMAAKAMGMTTAELDKFMADGKLTAEQLLPALAEALEEKYGRAAAEAANTAQGAINRMSNEWELFKKNVMDSGPMIDMINAVTDALASMNKIKNMQAERDRAVEFLKKEGIKPEGVKSDVQVLPDGTIIQPETYLEQYSERQIKAAIEYEKSQNRVNAYIEQGQKEEAEAISKGRAAIDKALKNTAEYQITALRNERDILIADIDKSIEAYKAQGKDTSSLLADRDKVIQVYNQKIEDAGKKEAKSAKSAAVAQADYNGELERTRQAIDSLQQQLGLDKTEDLARAKIRIEQQYQATLSKTNEELTKQVAQGKLTQGQADTLKAEKDKAAELQKQVALRDAERKAQEKSVQLAEGQLKFFKELGELSGDYGQSLTLQNRLIEKQAKEYREVYKISDELVDKWVELQKLQVSQDPFDGAYRGLLKFSAEYADSGKQWEKISYSFAGNFQSATREMFDNFLDTGRVSFASLERSFAALLKDMAYQALVQPVVLSIVGGVQQGVYGMTTAGRGGSGMGLNSLTGLPVSSILPESVTSGISGITGTVLPGTHVAGLMGPTTSGAALSGGLTIGSALGYGAFGGLGYSLLGGALGLPQNTYTGVTSSLGGALGAWGGAALGSTGALAGSIIGSALPFVGTALGALAGGLIGGLFGGGGDKDPWVNISSWVDLLGTIEQKDPYQARSYRTSGTGYEITANQGEGISWETGKQLADMAAGLSQEAIKSVATFRESVAAIGNDALEASFGQALEKNRFLKHWYEFEDREVKPEELMEDFQRAVQEKLYLSLTEVDLSTLATAADGAIADTIPEIAKAVTDSVNFVALGANLGEYQDDFNAAISGKLLDALNQIDTSGIALDVDKSSLAGWEAAAKALQAWDEVDTALTAILDPASELETAMSAAQGQFDGWLATLRKLGWQEEAVAGIEAKRASVLQSYASSLTRAVEEDLALRSLALRYGSDSGEYGLRSLQYRQQTELDELRKKLGEDSDLYQTMVQTQQAETTKYRIDLLEKELEDALAAEEQSRTRQASAMLSAAKSAEKLRDDMKKIAESFADARRDIWNSPADDLPGSSYLSSLASFDDAYLKALKGDEDALRDLPNLASGLLELGRENLATSEEYSDLFYAVDKKLKHVQESAQNGLIKGQSAQIDAITSQTGTLQAAINAGTAAGEYTGRSVDAIRAELEALQKLLTQQTAAITGAGSTTRREDLLQAKVEQLNESGYQGRRDWTISSLQNEMAAKNLTVEAWYDRYGRNENLGVKYDSAAARRDLLQRKADAMNAGRTLAGGQEAGGWTADRVEAAIKADGMTVDEWYLRFGRAEGFASGGITPVGRPFWVGERGPELMMGGSPHRVWSHTDSMALVERGRGGWDMTALLENGRGVLRELRSLNSRISRLEKYTRDTSDAVTRASVLGWTVTQEATA